MPTGYYQQARNGVKRLPRYGKPILFNRRRVGAGLTSTKWSGRELSGGIRNSSPGVVCWTRPTSFRGPTMDTPPRIIRLARQEKRARTFDVTNSMAQHERRGRYAMVIHQRWLRIMGSSISTCA